MEKRKWIFGIVVTKGFEYEVRIERSCCCYHYIGLSMLNEQESLGNCRRRASLTNFHENS